MNKKRNRMKSNWKERDRKINGERHAERKKER
jgi:hypothetical protein